MVQAFCEEAKDVTHFTPLEIEKLDAASERAATAHETGALYYSTLLEQVNPYRTQNDSWTVRGILGLTRQPSVRAATAHETGAREWVTPP